MNCLNCGAEVDNGLALCELCRRFVVSALEYLPVYFRNLSRWKPGQSGRRGVPGSRPPEGSFPAVGDGTHPVERALDEAATAMVTWARCLADDRPGRLSRAIDRILTFDEERTFRLLCVLFERHIVSIATTAWAGEFVRAVAKHEAVLRNLTERVVPGWYAGACRRPVWSGGDGKVLPCGTPTYVVPGLTWATCPGCGVTSHASEHLEMILDEAREWVARPKYLAEAIVALIDTEPSVPKLYTRIRQWVHAEKLVPIRRTERGYVWSDEEERIVVSEIEVGFARYRFGDVFDLALRKETRLVNDAQAS